MMAELFLERLRFINRHNAKEDSMSALTPKFLTTSLAQIAVKSTLECLYANGHLNAALKPHRGELHIVILVPGMTDGRPKFRGRKWSGHQLAAVSLYEHTLGDPKIFPYPFIEIARSKAVQLWHGRNDDRTEIIPHLLFEGDAPFWGGVKRHGIVVACSGLKPWVDKLVSGMVADMLIAMAHAAWEASPDKADKELCFLT